MHILFCTLWKKEQKLRTNTKKFFVQVSKRKYLSICNNSIIYSFIHSFILHNKCKSQHQQQIALRNLAKKYQRNLIPKIPLIFFITCSLAQIQFDLTHCMAGLYLLIVVVVVAVVIFAYLFVCKAACSFNLSTAEPMEIHLHRVQDTDAHIGSDVTQFTLFLSCVYFWHTGWSTSWS